MGGARNEPRAHTQYMKSATGTWYTEKGTEERPSSIAGMIDLYRAGKYIATVKAS